MYVIINGVNSDTIQGLQILSLPPITKPKMRTSVATIDGRPGDIVTYLGYEAYNKTIKILLHDTYDLPAIMAYFNQSGTIIFSNDPDKVYTFETIDQINYERAVKFKTASVTIHVQPYKLSATEEPATGEVETLVDKTPYIIRRTPFGTRQKGTIIGGSIVWNQLCNNASVTVVNGHKYLLKKDGAYSIGASTGTALTGLTVGSDMVFDLTLMFGPTIADYIYAQEQATAGAGVALAKAWAGIVNDYYPYDAGTLKSVTGLTAHRMTDGNSEVIGEYPLDSSLTLRGLPKLNGDNLYYDGDVYRASGEVERKYGILDMGSVDWTRYENASLAGGGAFYYSLNDRRRGAIYGFMISQRYSISSARGASQQPAGLDKAIFTASGSTQKNIYVIDSAYSTAEEFKTAMSGVYLLYTLETPTTEQAEPYTALQICDPNGTEEWVGANMPVGHETTYIDPISMTVTNEGNTESAPSITIEGEGSVEVTVDGLNILQIQMPASGEITIDSKTLDATDGEGGLANRSVIGDYNDLRLTPGEHTVTVTGDVTSVTIKNASRWI